MDLVNRLLIGDAPWAFMVEIAWRAVAMYALLLVFMRLMGKRVAAQLTTIETAVILMLGAAIGLPIQVLTQGILPAVVVLAVTTFMQRSLLRLALKSERFEALIYGDVILLLADGRMQLENLQRTKISRELLTSELRAHGVQHLGELRRVYIETSGGLSIIRAQHARPGLSLSPDRDASFTRNLVVDGIYACGRCGHAVKSTQSVSIACTFCGTDQWEAAVETLNTPPYQDENRDHESRDAAHATA